MLCDIQCWIQCWDIKHMTQAQWHQRDCSVLVFRCFPSSPPRSLSEGCCCWDSYVIPFWQARCYQTQGVSWAAPPDFVPFQTEEYESCFCCLEMCGGSGLKPQTLFLLQKPIAQAGSEWAALRFPCGQRGSYSCRVYKQTLPLVSFPCNSIHVRAFKLWPWVWTECRRTMRGTASSTPLLPCVQCLETIKRMPLYISWCSPVILLSLLEQEKAEHIHGYHCPTYTHPSTSPAQQSMGYSSFSQLLASSLQPTGIHTQNFPLDTAVSVPRV